MTQNNLLLDGGEGALQAVEDVMSSWNYAVGADPQKPVAIIVIDDFSTDEPADQVDWSSASHGWYVLDVLNRLYATLPQASQDQIAIETLDVNEQAFRSDRIRAALIDQINDLHADLGITRFVLNMSFVFVECDTIHSNRPIILTSTMPISSTSVVIKVNRLSATWERPIHCTGCPQRPSYRQA